GDSAPTSCDSFRASDRKQLRIFAGHERTHYGSCQIFRGRCRGEEDTWPWLERWSATGDTTPAWRIQPPRPTAERDTGPRPTTGTWVRKRCRSTVLKRMPEWRSAWRCPTPLRPCPCQVPLRGCG